MSATQSRAQRRRLAAACDAADKMVKADERFFARFPHRTHRVRLASRSEMDANALAAGLDIVPSEGVGLRWYCAVKNLAPGCRSRVFLQNEAGLDTELSEWQAQYVYDLVARPGTKAFEIEQTLRAVLKARGRA